jgi:hypothetical protein
MSKVDPVKRTVLEVVDGALPPKFKTLHSLIGRDNRIVIWGPYLDDEFDMLQVGVIRVNMQRATVEMKLSSSISRKGRRGLLPTNRKIELNDPDSLGHVEKWVVKATSAIQTIMQEVLTARAEARMARRVLRKEERAEELRLEQLSMEE